MSRIVELVKCPVCRCNMVKDEECTMCADLEWEAAHPE